MSKSVQIREMPDEVVTVLRTRAAGAGLSLSAYLRTELTDIAKRPMMAELLQRADERRARDVGAATDDVVALQRETRGQ